MLKPLIEFDRYVFLLINQKGIFSYGDLVFPWVRQAQHWYFLYFILLIFGYVVFRKNFFWWLLFLIVTICFSDQFSSSIIKPLFGRLRPCADPQFYSQVRLLVGCPSASYSFTSSHAMNHFAAALFFFRSFKPSLKIYSYLFFAWAGMICYGQIYVGVHFPLDIFIGALLGLGLGFWGFELFRKRNLKNNLKNN